jgi:hypothetical protein
MALAETDIIVDHQQQQQPTNPAAAFAQNVGALERDAVLQMIFSMLGSKAWLLIGGVNRQWRDLYAAMAKQKETSAGCIVASLSTYQYAKLCGREFTDHDGAVVGQHAGLDVVVCCAADMRLYTILSAAFESRRADMLQLLQALGPEVCRSASQHMIDDDDSQGVLCLAAQHRSLDCLQFLALKEGSYQIKDCGRIRCAVSRAAATGGHLPTLQWLQQHAFLQDFGWHNHLCEIAARCGHIDAVIWLHAQGFALGPMVCSAAAEAGNYQLLQRLRSHGAQWLTELMPAAAARGGSTEMLRHLRDTAVGRWDPAAVTRLLFEAGQHGHLAAAQWLYALGGALPTQLWDAYNCWPHLCTLQWAIESGASWGAQEGAEEDVRYECEQLMELLPHDAWVWAHEHGGCPCQCTNWQQQ